MRGPSSAAAAEQGWGAATVTELANRGAEIHVLDLKEPPGRRRRPPVGGPAKTRPSGRGGDRQDRRADRRPVQLCRAAGTPVLRPGHDVVNFAVMRHLAACCLPRCPRAARSPASRPPPAPGTENIAKWMPLAVTAGFAEAKQWCEDSSRRDRRPATCPSKEAIIVWTMHADLVSSGKRGIRVNCISPGPTDTPMMPCLRGLRGQGPHRHLRARSGAPVDDPREQAYPLLFLNSRGRLVRVRSELHHRRRHRRSAHDGQSQPELRSAGGSRLTLGDGRRPEHGRSTGTGVASAWRCLAEPHPGGAASAAVPT